MLYMSSKYEVLANDFNFKWMKVFPVFMYVYHVCVRRGNQHLGMRVKYDCELSGMYRHPNPGAL